MAIALRSDRKSYYDSAEYEIQTKMCHISSSKWHWHWGERWQQSVSLQNMRQQHNVAATCTSHSRLWFWYWPGSRSKWRTQQQPIKSKNLSITINYIFSLKKLDNKKLAFVVLTNKKPKMCDDQKRVWGHQSCGWVLSSPSPHCVYLICPSDNYSANFVATNLPHSCRIPSKDISPRSHSSLASFDQLIKQIFAYLGST